MKEVRAMGYRSSYQILVEAPKDKMDAFFKWLKTQEEMCKELEKKAPIPSSYGFTVGETYENIQMSQIDLDIVNADNGLARAAFEHDYWKCYDPWDLVINQIDEYCTDNDIAFAYGRLGESMEDAEFQDNDLGLYVGFVRKFVSPFEG